jgi:periplasmic copper chaperone A
MKTLLAVALVAAAPVALLAGPAAGQEARAGDLVIKDAVVRAMPAGAPNTAAYLTIVNEGGKPDALVSASCDCARSVEPHLSHVMDGQAMMMPAGPVTVPAKGDVSFSPGGYHLMVMGLKGPLKDGSLQEMTLKFRHAGAIKAPFRVETRIETAPAQGVGRMKLR